MHLIRLQAAVDFLMSYGIAFIVIAIAIAVIAKVVILTPTLVVSTCTPSPGFVCQSYFINTNGILTLQLVQATGGTLLVKGIACSTLPNTTGNLPASGNVKVTGWPTYYPSGMGPGQGVTMYSGNITTFTTYCFSQKGIDKGILGNPFIGYVWINYSTQGYGNGNIIQQVATINVRYT